MTTLRYAQKTDISELMELWWALHLHHIEGLGTHRRTDYTPTAQAGMRRYLLTHAIPRREVIVATSGGQVVGFCAFHNALKPPIYRQRKYLQISDLYIRPAFRHGGVGAALLKKAIAVARERGLARVDISADAANKAAHRFYLSQGLKVKRLLFVKRL